MIVACIPAVNEEKTVARVVLTDSGGVQEKTCIMRVPCVTLRYNTERPETLEVGSNMLAGTDPYEIVEKTELMLSKERGWVNPFGDGRAGERIIHILRDKFRWIVCMMKLRDNVNKRDLLLNTTV